MQHRGPGIKYAIRGVWVSLLLCFCVASVSNVAAQKVIGPTNAQQKQSRRSFTVADSIEMTDVGASPSSIRLGNLAQFSPDGSRFVIVLQKGNLQKNTVEYSLFLFASQKVFKSPLANRLVTFASSSNRPAISQVKWLADNETIAFLGERPGALPQVYTINIRTKQIDQLTHHQTEIQAFGVTDRGNRVVYLAQAPCPESSKQENWQRGFVVTNERVDGLITGDCRDYGVSIPEQVFATRPGSQPAIKMGDELVFTQTWWSAVSISPDGRFAIIPVDTLEYPRYWGDYNDPLFHRYVKQTPSEGVTSIRQPISRLMLVDARAKSVEPLWDAPNYFYASSLAWSSDSKSVVIANALLPLNTSDLTERERRKSFVGIAKIDLISKEMERITLSTRIAEIVKSNYFTDFVAFEWNAATNRVLLRSRNDGRLVAYHKTAEGWIEERPSPDARPIQNLLRVTVNQGLNEPPTLIAAEPKMNRRVELLNLNPQFRDLSFGMVQDLKWKAKDGDDWRGGLYLPPDYVPGTRYPLVIQTHGFDPTQFRIDGYSTTANAAQALAGRGIIVLQMGRGTKRSETDETPREGPAFVAACEAVIDLLDARAMIDPKRVGIVGFSRSSYWVKYMLTHSSYRLAAATVADGVDVGYVGYMISSVSLPSVALTYDRVNGSPPFGEGLEKWLKVVPNFNLDKIRTPVRIEALNRHVILQEWETYSGLRRLGKPVEMIYLPDGAHPLVKPWERMMSQQGNVDWFCFWLKGEEDPAPSKKGQYARWRELRKMQEANAKSTDKKLIEKQ